MKLIFMGTPDFAAQVLKALAGSGHEVVLAVSQPDKPKGRGHLTSPTAVKETAAKLGISVFQPEKIGSDCAVEKISDTPADAVIVAAFGQILPSSIIHMKKYGCINVHASLLPAYRGAAPIQWAVINGEKESGVTIMQMDEGLDTGDILLKRAVPLDDDETGGSLFDKLADLGGRTCVEALDLLETDGLVPVPQGEAATAYASMLTREMGHIDWDKSAQEIERLIRGLNPWPGTYTGIAGKMLKVWRADVLEETWDASVFPGTIVNVTKNDFTVACGRGSLKVTELQLQGRKRMETAAFLRGFRLETGTVLA